MTTPPAVLCFSGLDPTGGAGIQADIQTLSLLGCHPCPVISCLTIQDSHNVQAVQSISPNVILEQIRVLLTDIEVNYLKVGLLPDTRTIECLHAILKTHPKLKLILDPILRAGGGLTLTSHATQIQLQARLFPQVHLLTPNLAEAQTLANITTQDTSEIADILLKQGCKHLLLTDTQPNTSEVTLELWQHHKSCIRFTTPKLPYHFHGTGCTLTSAIAGYLAKGESIHEAIEDAMRFIATTLNTAYPLGSGQLFPNRLT